jgi:YihY family inner membrane protein
MATSIKGTQTNAKQNEGSEVMQTVEKDVRPFQAFFTKFNNDWCMNFAGALAYSLLMSMVPIAIAVLAILGFVLGSLDPTGQAQLTTNITHVLPSVSTNLVDQAQKQLAKSAGILAFIAVILALYSGSRLFVQIEAFFSIIYHVRQRQFLQQNLMAFGMLLIFIILIPVMTVAAAAPSLVISPVAKFLPGPVLTLIGILGGLLAAFLFFQAIYMVVPNQRISWRNAMPGAVVAAIALQLYLILFPLYVSHFLGSYATGPVSLIILLVFFYYFAVILLLGAEVNAFFAEKVQATPTDLPTMVHIVTSHLPKRPAAKEQQAAASHKEVQTGSIRQKAEQGKVTEKARHDVSQEQIEAITTAATQGGLIREPNTPASMQVGKPATDDKHEEHLEKKEPVKATPAASKPVVIAEAVAGTGLAFLLEWLRMRGGRKVRQ